MFDSLASWAASLQQGFWVDSDTNVISTVHLGSLIVAAIAAVDFEVIIMWKQYMKHDIPIVVKSTWFIYFLFCLEETLPIPLQGIGDLYFVQFFIHRTKD